MLSKLSLILGKKNQKKRGVELSKKTNQKKEV
jgi:hypothetical protein